MEACEKNFFGVYLLNCLNPNYKGRTYIGYTVNPQRRIKQHNAGKHFGGACKTNNKGPWTMVLIVYGFPSSTSALRFEWAWQHPAISRRLKHVPRRKSRQKVFDFCLLVLSEMLKVGPWVRLPLTLHWLDSEFADKYSYSISPPMHMPITYGSVTSKKNTTKSKKKRSEKDTFYEAKDSLALCSLCGLIVNAEDKVTCIKSDCLLVAHLICLAEEFSKDEMILPIDGICPACKTNVLWGDLIRKKIGHNLHLTDNDKDD
ncbi:structure-specific endonuclease subunit slx1 [Orussus abietinus]|uniref:structure-specific endonuclease subunit slx1 n=1 Tax=Orussus abietinus TaxID=222816 RepID=UPI000626E17A|nr:structure-specific endonuclease subunit slx1 [Orussus abietinus]XP_012270086.1 structure-specific endonuclease subunit slx1 [Orussus abietinus]